MRKVRISDVTIRNGSENGLPLTFRETLELAKCLDRLGLDVIESAPIRNRRTDSLLIKSLSSSVRDAALAVPVSVTEPELIEVAWAALREARSPRLQITAPTSPVQMEYFCHAKPKALLEKITQAVSAASALCPQVEFIAEDAGRAEPAFLEQALNAAVAAGAVCVTICDSAGNLLPEEYADSVRRIRAALPADISLGVQCSNRIFLADACAMAALAAGADEVKVAACGDYTASLERVAGIVLSRGEDCGVFSTIRSTELRRILEQIRRVCLSRRSKASPFDDGVQESRGEILLTAHDDIHAVTRAAEQLGYDLSEEDRLKVFEAFGSIAAHKDEVGGRELDAIIAAAALQVPPTYRLDSYVINCGNVITATAHIRLHRGERLLEGVCVGDGPVDAAFLAIEQITGHHYELDDFQIQAVTEGREAMGETVVRLRSEGKLYSGRGISTDIIGSSVLAYINAVNKIVYEEETGA